LTAQPDPLALIISIGGGAISVLLALYVAAKNKQAADLAAAVKGIIDAINGSDGLFMRLVRTEGYVEQARAEIAALKAGTLSREVFDRATDAQNAKLNTIDAKVELVDLMIRPRPGR
jgi:hypothetical protein